MCSAKYSTYPAQATFEEHWGCVQLRALPTEDGDNGKRHVHTGYKACYLLEHASEPTLALVCTVR